MKTYVLFAAFATTSIAQSTYTDSGSGSTSASSLSTSSVVTTSAVPSASQVCGVAGYDLGNPKAAAYDGSGLYGTFDTCKSWCTNYLSFAVGSGVCLCYAAPVAGNLNAVSTSPNVYYDMTCPEPATVSSDTTTSTTTFTLVSSSTSSATTSSVYVDPGTTATTAPLTTTSAIYYTTSSSTTTFSAIATSTSSTVTLSSTTTSAKTTVTTSSTPVSSVNYSTKATTSTTSVVQYTTTKPPTTSSVPSTLVTKTTTATTTTSTPTSTSACFRIKVNNQYVALSSSLLSNVATTSSTPSTFYVDKSGYLRNAADNYALMRTAVSLLTWNSGYLSRLGLFYITTTKNSNSKTLTFSTWYSGVAPIWTCTKDSGLQHGTTPGNGWLQTTVSYEDATCPTTVKAY